MGQSQLTDKEKMMRMCQFWKINVWWVAFIAMSLIYNVLVAQVLAPYPMIFMNRLIEFSIFVVVYIVVCVRTTIDLGKKEKSLMN